VCPAIILANKRIDKLIGLKIYDINSIGTNKNAKPIEVPAGKNKEKKMQSMSSNTNNVYSYKNR